MPEFTTVKPKSSFTLTVGTLGVLTLLAAGYVLFLGATPHVEVVLPDNLQSVSELSKIQFDPASVVGSPEFRALRSYSSASIGPTGRSNPFLPF